MNANQIAQIATSLNVFPNQIKKAEEWANVLFVVVTGLGARFVSKKVIKMDVIIDGSTIWSADRTMFCKAEGDHTKDYVWLSCEAYGLEDNTQGQIGYHTEYRPLDPFVLAFVNQAAKAWSQEWERREDARLAKYLADTAEPQYWELNPQYGFAE